MIPVNDKLAATAAFQKVLIPSNARFFKMHGYMEVAPHSSDEVQDLNAQGGQRVCDQYAAMADYDRYMLHQDSLKEEVSGQE